MAEKSYPLISLSKDLTILSRESIISSTKNWPWMCWKGSSLDLGQGAMWATAKPWQSSLSDATHVILASQHLSKSHIHFSSKLERCQDEALKVPENVLLFFCPELLLHPSSHHSEATFAKSHIIDELSQCISEQLRETYTTQATYEQTNQLKFEKWSFIYEGAHCKYAEALMIQHNYFHKIFILTDPRQG